MIRPAAEDIAAASRFYSRVLRLYPRAHREALGEQMLRSFEDHYRDAASATGRPPLAFWIAVLIDEGRSLLREQATWVLGAALGAWLAALLVLPNAVPLNRWAVLFLPALICAGLFLLMPGLRSVTRAAIAVLWFAITAGVIVGAHSISDMADLVAPALLLCCCLFSLKAMAGWHAMLTGKRITGSAAELAYSLPIGIAGIVGFALLASPADNDGMVKVIFYLLIPFVCAAVGFPIGLRQTSGLASLYSALSAMLTGAAIWFLARPVLLDLSHITSLFSQQASSAIALAGWQRDLGPVLLLAALFAVGGAAMGQLVRVEALTPSRIS